LIDILKCIKNAPGKKLLYENKGIPQVVGYSNTDWPGSPADKLILHFYKKCHENYSTKYLECAFRIYK